MRGVTTRGVYAVVRHPMYAAYMLLFVAYVAGEPSAHNATFAVAACALLVVRLRSRGGRAGAGSGLSGVPPARALASRARMLLNREVNLMRDDLVQASGLPAAARHRPRDPLLDGRRPGTRFGRAALLCSATLGVALAAGPVFAAASPALQFVRHDIDPGVFGQVTEGINVGDIDGDGRPDIVVGGDNYLVWFHNPDWAPNLIASGFKFAGGAMVVVRDIDGDGRLDVMTGKYPLGHKELRQTVWYGNTPSGWAEHLVSTTSFCHDLAFGDFDGDGHEDAVCDDQFLDQIVWLHGPASPTVRMADHPDRRASPPWATDVADIDRDGRPDVVAGRGVVPAERRDVEPVPVHDAPGHQRSAIRRFREGLGPRPRR